MLEQLKRDFCSLVIDICCVFSSMRALMNSFQIFKFSTTKILCLKGTDSDTIKGVFQFSKLNIFQFIKVVANRY